MVIKRDKEDIVIRLNSSFISIEEVQKLADHLRILESNAQNQGTEEQAAQLSMESHKNWLKENSYRFTK